VLAVATPAGHIHELGALLASSVAYEAGWDVLYLGADLPAEDIAAAVKSRGARAILLSLVFPHGDSATIAELKELRLLVGPELPIFAGGQAVPSYTVALAELGALAFSGVEDLDEALRHI
jgi:methylmalonyl-CoA mutase cobalamin-binding subunit